MDEPSTPTRRSSRRIPGGDLPSGWAWDRNTTHKAGYFVPITVFSRLFPRPVSHAVAVGLGSILAHTMRKTRRILHFNLTRVGRGRYTEEKISRLILQTFHNYARYLVDFMNMMYLGRDEVPRYIRRFAGRKTFEKALERGKGILLVTPHFGNWELGGALLSSQGYSLNVVSLVTPDPAMMALREKVREKLGIRHIYVGKKEGPLQMLGILDALRRNEIVAMLCDRDSSTTPVTVDLFGFPFVVPTGPVVLGMLTGTTLIPSFVIHRRGKYEAFIGKPILVNGAGKKGRNEIIREKTAELTREFERVISRFPDQWYNFYPAWANKPGI
jgi:KDO2-lipid IV(A) lauroyltransferase